MSEPVIPEPDADRKPTQADFQLAREWADAMQYEGPYRVSAILGYAHALSAARAEAEGLRVERDADQKRVLVLEAQVFKMAQWLLTEKYVAESELEEWIEADDPDATPGMRDAFRERIEQINALLDGSAGVSHLADMTADRDALRAAIAEHHRQKADDRCIEDDDRLYAAAGLPPCDRRVGDKAAMLRNCERFIDRRCEGGGWPSYAEMERRVAVLEAGLRESRTHWPLHTGRLDGREFIHSPNCLRCRLAALLADPAADPEKRCVGCGGRGGWYAEENGQWVTCLMCPAADPGPGI